MIILEVKEIVNKLVESKDRRHKIVYIKMGTDDGEASFAPRYGFTILGQKRYAQSTLDELIANGVPVKEPSK